MRARDSGGAGSPAQTPGHDTLAKPMDPTIATTDPLAGVRAGYDRWALVYDHDANPLPALEEPHVRAALPDVRGLDVVDLGCGTGRHTAWLAAAGARVTAIDFSSGMLACARGKVDPATVRFVVHDLHEALPIGNASFDVAVSGLVLEHLRDLPAFFREMRRVLRPGGRAVVSAMHPAMFLRDSRARFTDPDTGTIEAPGSVCHRFGEVVMAAAGAGFAPQHIGEHAPDADFARRYPRARRYVGWPMLLLLALRADATPAP